MDLELERSRRDRVSLVQQPEENYRISMIRWEISNINEILEGQKCWIKHIFEVWHNWYVFYLKENLQLGLLEVHGSKINANNDKKLTFDFLGYMCGVIFGFFLLIIFTIYTRAVKVYGSEGKGSGKKKSASKTKTKSKANSQII